MHILYINHFAGSKKHGMEFRPYFLGKPWVKLGNKVSIIASSFAHTRVIQPDIKNNLQKECIDGINYYWIKCPEYKGIGTQRLINFLFFIIQLIFHSRRIANTLKPEIVIASSTFLLDIYPAYLIAKFTKSKLVYEFPDLMPISLTEVFNYKKYHPFILLLAITERFIYKVSSRIVCVLPNGYEHMSKFGLLKEKYSFVPNGLDIESWHESNGKLPPVLIEKINEFKSKDFFLIGYAGYISKQNSLETLINSAVLLKDEKICFLIVGDGPFKKEIVEMAENKSLKNLIFFDPIPKVSVPAFLNQMDALFIAFRKLKLYEYGVNTNKLYDYLMSGKPVIQSQNAGNDLVAEANCGISCPAEDPDSVKQGILKLKNMSTEDRRRLGLNGQNHVINNYDYKILSKRYITELLRD